MFKRLADAMKERMNEQLEKAEEPAVFVEGLIRGMDEQIIELQKELARAISAVGIAEKSYSADPSNELNVSLAKAHKKAVDRTITLFEERIHDVRLKQRQLQSLESRQAASDLVDQIVKDFNGLASKADAMLDPESQ